MRKLLLLCTLFVCYACSTRDIVEQNIEEHISTYLPEYEIVSAEYSRLYTCTVKDSKDIPSDALTEDEVLAQLGATLLPLSNSLNKNSFDWVISNDRIAKKWDLEADTYLKLGFFKFCDKNNDEFDAGFGFIIDSAYNVERALIIDDSKDYKYIYSCAFNKKQR